MIAWALVLWDVRSVGSWSSANREGGIPVPLPVRDPSISVEKEMGIGNGQKRVALRF